LIPDIQHEEFPSFFSADDLRSRRAAFARVLSSAGAIGTISEFSRAKLVERQETKCADVFLMGPALPREHAQDGRNDCTPEELALIPKNKYFIYPANLWPHKNHRRILQAFDRFVNSTGHQMEFVLTGNEEGWPVLRDAFPALPVRHLGYVRPQLVRLLIERATALVFFSLYEGFGIPLLEAFNVGTPVLCSNTTSFPEIGGDAVLSCDPMDIDAMSQLMRTVVEDSTLRGRLAPKGKARLSLFSWDTAASNLITACERVAAKPFVLPYDAVLEVTQKLIRQLRASEEDRAARLTVIEGLDAEVTELRSILNRRVVRLSVQLTRFGRARRRQPRR
jgi:glycosyltransferase involved in cell wall biosynthesis